MRQDASSLVDLSRVDPTTTLREAELLIDLTEEPAELVLLWRAIGMAKRVKGDAAASVVAFRRAVAIAGDAALHDQRVLNSLSLASSLGFAGELDEALSILAQITAGPESVGRVHFQRATILVQAGRLREAIVEFDRAIPHLEANDDTYVLGMTFNNLGLALLAEGDARGARDTFERGLAVLAEADDPLQTASTGYNLARALAAAGDLVEALEWFNRTIPTMEEIAGPSFDPGRCNALLAAGLFEEAHEEAVRLAHRLEEVGMLSEIPEAWLLAAEASLLLGRQRDAADEAGHAASLFQAQDRTPWMAVAQLLVLESGEVSDGALPAELDALIKTLEESGMVAGVVRARTAAARSLARRRDVAAARQALEAAIEAAGARTLATDLDLSLAEVEVLRAAGDRRRAARLAAAGMRRLEAQQRAVAATDVRAGLGRKSTQLARHGLELATESRGPRRVWEWIERSRATALAYRPVNPPDQDDVAALLAELRALSAAAAQPTGNDTDTRRKLKALEARIADVTRAASGGAQRAVGTRVTEHVLERLEDRALIELAIVGHQLWAVIAFRGRTRLVEVGAAAEWVTDVKVLSSAVRHALLRPGEASPRLARLVRAIGSLIEPLVPPGAASLVIAPPPEMVAVPWAALSPVPVAIVPSAATWLRAHHEPVRSRTAVAASGPDLDHARSEAELVGSVHPHCAVVHAITVDAALRVLGEADVVHLACHGRLRSDQPLFTSLRMQDGELYLHEAERLSRLPALLVLSSCESGSSAGVGSEMLGMATVLLAAGVRTVIASPWQIPDTAVTVDTMGRLHELIVGGFTPAESVQAIAREMPGFPYLVFGA